MPLFHKVMVLADLHFGRTGNSPQANQDNLDFLAWAIDEARTWGARTCIMLGDWHDNRHSLAVATMLASVQGMEMLNAAFDCVWWLPGNHDLLYKDRRDAASIEFARWLPNVRIVREPVTIDDVALVPWLLTEEHKSLDLTCRYVFGHLEIAGFLRNAKSVMPEAPDSITSKQFIAQDYCFTGHFHKRQIERNVCYIGNIMPFNFSDDGEDERGLMLLEWGKEPIFRSWPDQPLYRSIKLSELFNTEQAVLKPNMTLRLNVDVSLEYDEAQRVRETLMEAYSLRKIELNHTRDEIDQDEDLDMESQTVDQIVLQGLQSIESVGMSNEKLIAIYQSLI